MFSSKRRVIICDIQSSVDSENLNRTWKVSNARAVICDKKLVGVQSQQLASLQNMTFSYTIELDRMFYNEQKYLYMDKNLYTIQNIVPAKLDKNCKLNIVLLEDAEMKSVIEGWINANL